MKSATFWVHTVVIVLLNNLMPMSASGSHVPEPLAELIATCTPDAWVNSSGWSQHVTMPVCSWWGIECDVFGRITAINLYDNGLGGSHCAVPKSISSLPALKFLSLGNNNLSRSSIPNSIGLLADLRYLNLEMTGIAGHLPCGIGNLF